MTFMKKVMDLLPRERVINLSGQTKDEVLDELCALIAAAPSVTDPVRLAAAIRRRETIMSTGIGMGIAIPHAKISEVTDFVMAAGRSREGIEFQSLDGNPVHLVILIAASNTQGDEFLRLLAKIGRFFNNEAHRERFLSAGSDEDIYRLFQHLDDHDER